LKAGALFIPIRQVAQPSVGSCIVLIICVMLSDVNLHYLTLAARCPISRCWPSCLSWQAMSHFCVAYYFAYNCYTASLS